MRKREMISAVREVMTGNSAHTHIIFGRRNNMKWDVLTDVNQIIPDLEEWECVGSTKHLCNDITIAEVTEHVEEQLKNCYC